MSSAAPPPRAAKASCWPKPGALDEWPRSRGRLVSKPKKDMGLAVAVVVMVVVVVVVAGVFSQHAAEAIFRGRAW